MLLHVVQEQQSRQKGAPILVWEWAIIGPCLLRGAAMRLFLAALLLSSTGPALAESLPCDQGIVWEDSNGNGRICPMPYE